MSARLQSTGDVIADRYEILDYLNEGGMQEVYVAQDTKLKRTVALKVPKNDSGAKRFDRSAHLSAKVRHPNVAATLDYFIENDKPYLIEELVPGSDLKNRMDTEFLYLDPHLAAHVFSHLARGVSAAHHVGVCHRDLKPSNIIVSPDPSLSAVKITDFGIAKLADEQIAEEIDNMERDSSSLTGSHTLVGAIPYMAPERLSDPRQVDLKSDSWALGAILYHLIAGEPPFGRGPAAIAKILGTASISAPSIFGKFSAFKELEDALWRIIQKTLSKDPDSRPSADELVKACSELCYATQSRQTGTINSFGGGLGDYGTITAADNTSVFLHKSEFYGRDLKVGMRVNFAAHDGRPNPRAAPAIPLRS